jgi:hypothetical protein
LQLETTSRIDRTRDFLHPTPLGHVPRVAGVSQWFRSVSEAALPESGVFG